ncbi:hypothetical protein [Paucibacter sp. XJ19-41]|uniref:hypothetical protein n=1 Tax=Paucibacter sp. XJ19-41 TaxID=2927824 RepID=UPI00234B9DAC|nr:hypothetical protein [Paucibacter sp. XJ19-41]MDC6170893.1 hypothetical protein [Paucibacter sp. XJ19-41]
MLRYIAIAVAAWVGAFDYGRLFATVVIALCLVGGVYWLALPTILPLWPAVLVMALAVAAGLAWEHRAAKDGRALH